MAASADPKTPQLYEFGPFRLDPEKELLLREDESVAIAPKAFQILLVLIRHNKQVVAKDDLMKAIWPDTFVEDANVSRNIFLLRKALGESPQDHHYIVTVPGRGYRFAEEVQLVPDRELNIVAASHSNVEVQVEETRPGDGSPPRQFFSSWWPPAPGSCSSIAHRCLLKKTPSCSPTSRIPPAIRPLMAHCARAWLCSWNNRRS
jgi:DNA-binding winged helix-turn-helix (wHTH) protein